MRAAFHLGCVAKLAGDERIELSAAGFGVLPALSASPIVKEQ